MTKSPVKGRQGSPPRPAPTATVGIETPEYGCGSYLGAVSQGLTDALLEAGVTVGVLGHPNVRGHGIPPNPPTLPDAVISFADPSTWKPQRGQTFIGIVPQVSGEHRQSSWEAGLRLADAVFAPSQWVASIVGPKAKVLRFGIRTEFSFSPKLDGRPFRVLFSAENSAAPESGMVEAVDAFKQAFPDSDRVELTIRSLDRSVEKDDHRVRLLFGNLTPAQSAELYRSADVMLYPSWCESYPLVALEALACGTPVVHSGKTGLSEISDLGIAALSREVSPSRFACYPEDLAQTLRSIFDRPAAAHELARRDSEVVERDFRWNIDPLLRFL